VFEGNVTTLRQQLIATPAKTQGMNEPPAISAPPRTSAPRAIVTSLSLESMCDRHQRVTVTE
jgi:hypothetical protein